MSDVKKIQESNGLIENIHLRCLYGPAHGGARIYPVRNPLTWEYPSCIRKVNSSGDIIYKSEDNPGQYFIKETDSFVIKNGTDFDLSNDIQKANWEAIKFSELIWDPKGKFDENGNEIAAPSELPSPTSIFYVERIADEAKKRNTLERKKNTAKNYIYNDSDTALKLKAKILGCFIKTSTREEIEEFIVSIANTDPDRVITLYTGSDAKLYLICISAIENNILRNKGGIYMYNDDFIGRSNDDIVNYFKNPKNKVITDCIIKDTTKMLVDNEGIEEKELNPSIEASENTTK